MKKLFTLFAMMFLLVGGLFAQKLSYQAVVRDNDNKLVVNTALTVEVSILNANNGVQYAETHNATSNQNGLIVLTIGEGTVTSGTNLSAVNWEGATINSVIKNGNTTVATISSPVNAVPYALQAANASGSFSQVQADWAETNTASKAYIMNKPNLNDFATIEDLGAKADTTAVKAALATKANTSDIPTTVAQLSDATDYAKVADMTTALGAKADTAAVKAALETKANTSDIPTTVASLTDAADYAKVADMTTALGAKADTATVNAALATKANTSDIPTTVASLTDAADYAKVADMNTALGAKADTAAVNAALATKANTSDIPTTVASLTDAADYAKVADMTTALGSKADTSAVKAALATKANTSDIPTTVASLTDAADYAKVADMTTALGAKADTAAVKAALETKANTSDIPTTVANLTDAADYAKVADVTTALGAKADTTAVKAALETKANVADVYNKVQVDQKLDAKANLTDIHNSTITINQNGAPVGSFTLNQTGDQTINLAGGSGSSATQTININGKVISLTPGGGEIALPKYDYNQDLVNTPDLSGFATTTAMNDALATMNNTLGLKANTADLATVATTGDYNDLSGTPDLSNYVTTNALATAGYATQSALNDSVADLKAQMNQISSQLNQLMTALTALQVTSKRFVAQAAQTEFNLGQAANGEIVCYVNGVMVGSKTTGVVTVNANNIATYVPAQNYGYELQAGDVVTFMYIANN